MPESNFKQPLQDNNFFSWELSPFLKWPGGKSSELKKIADSAPMSGIDRFIEPFVGGGSVLLSVNTEIPALANDICPELIDLYQSGSNDDKVLKLELNKLSNFFEFITKHDDKWLRMSSQLMESRIEPEEAGSAIIQVLDIEIRKFGNNFYQEFSRRLYRDLPKKLKRIKKLQIEKKRELPLQEFANNVEGSIKAAFYMAVRERYNGYRRDKVFNKIRTADFLFLREYCYASMFRFNSKGEFNIPYGGISYNRKDFTSKIEKLFNPTMRNRLKNTKFSCLDFEDFLNSAKLIDTDFIFVDPPYDSDFTDYDGKEFRNNDQERLASYLNDVSSRVMLVIGDTTLIRKLYSGPKWRIQEDNMQYKWTIKSRNDRGKTHLTITNY
jgi:DNA adenine methylase